MRGEGLCVQSDCWPTVSMLDTQRHYGSGWSTTSMYTPGGYVDDNMPLSDGNYSYSAWSSDQYGYPQYPQDNVIHSYPDLLNDDQKYTPQDPLAFEQSSLTAIGKPSPYSDDVFYNDKSDCKPMRQWDHQEVMIWLCDVAYKNGYDCEKINLRNFQGIIGNVLMDMSEHEFLEKDRHIGYFFYQAVAGHRREEECRGRLSELPPFGDIRNNEDGKTLTDLSSYKHIQSDIDSDQSDSSFHEIKDVKPLNIMSKSPPPTRKGKVGRPPKMGRTKRGNKEKKCGRLWEFIRDLLKKPEYCPSLICWENHDEGVFRFVRSDKVAELWGTIKENPKMTYEKLSRAMRYYYKSKVLQPVLGRRLVYKFGPTARDWQSPDPNFRNSSKKPHESICI